ncbi:MAG: hypothetical protein M3Y75_10740 [Actinomycetota bacterium]|nr:hypothetical protein [Actinomycetota bacterium]
MPKPSYEIDDQGNLIEKDGGGPEGTDDGAEEVTPEQARRFLLVLALSELLGVAILLVSGLIYLPEQRTLILAASAAYALFSLGVFLYMRRHVYSQVKRPTEFMP